MSQPSAFQRFVRELRRRHVPQTAAVYLVAAWAAIEFADVVVPNLNGPQWVVTAVIVAALTGLPVVLVLAWVFDWGPDGFHRTGADEAAAGTPAQRSATPVIAVVAVLVVGIGSALAVAALLANGAEGAGGDRGDGRAPADAPGDFGVPGRPELTEPLDPDSLEREILRGLGDVERWRRLGRLGAVEGLVGLGALDSLDADEVADMARLAAQEADLSVLVREPRQWRLDRNTAVPLAPGDTLRVEGLAVDTAGVVSVAVDGEVVARGDEGRELLRFSAMVLGTADTGPRRLEIVVRTADDRTIRREYAIEQRAAARP